MGLFDTLSFSCKFLITYLDFENKDGGVPNQAAIRNSIPSQENVYS